MSRYFVGLMSGTSMDGIDAALVSFGRRALSLHATTCVPYPAALSKALLAEAGKPQCEPIDESGELDRHLGQCFRDAALEVIAAAGVPRSKVEAIGSHGQTLRHRPDATPPYSIQLGNPDIIARGTGIRTIADFRRADLAAGGQGAPLVPPFHHWLFASPQHDRAVVNIGGIANATLLPAAGVVTGFDTGPGNGLMDAWSRCHIGEAFDAGGQWADSGAVLPAVLEAMLADPYFQRDAPKSTGFEYFNLDWIRTYDVDRHAAADVQATLCELTAATIATAVQKSLPAARELYICGGGAHNVSLCRRLAACLPNCTTDSTAVAGLHPDWVEAAAFAWLARQTLNNEPGNLPTVTGASHEVVLGRIHLPSP